MIQPTLEQLVLKKATFYHLRLSVDDLTERKTQQVLDDPELGISHYILATEGDGVNTRYHQHVMLGGSEIDKKQIAKVLKDMYVLKGNPDYSFKLVKSKRNMSAYVVKEDAGIVFKGFTVADIAQFKKRSYSKTKFEDAYKKLGESLDDNVINLYEYSQQLYQLKADCNQPVNLRSMDNHILSKAIKKGILRSSDMADGSFRRLDIDPDSCKYCPEVISESKNYFLD